MSYRRVLPRDLFNEAKLLKCLGRLALLIEDGLAPESLSYEHSTSLHEGFEIEQSITGNISVVNLHFLVNGEMINLESGLNSRLPYPLKFGEEDGYVFDDNGVLTLEFMRYCK